MKRGGPLKRSTKPMAYGGLPAPTKAQQAIFDKLIDQVGCAVCLFHCRHEDGSRVEGSIGEIHHILSGTKRISHSHVIPLCRMHHTDGKPGNPSRHSITGKYGKAEFEVTFGTEAELAMLCEEWINEFYFSDAPQITFEGDADPFNDDVLLFQESKDDEPEAAQCNDRDTDTDANGDGDNRDVQKESIPLLPLQKFSKPVRVAVMHYRVRKADFDNLNAKGALDGIVKAGLLQDDSPKYVQGPIIHDQKNVKTYAEEKTVVTLTEVI